MAVMQVALALQYQGAIFAQALRAQAARWRALTLFANLDHRPQAASADIYSAHLAIDLESAMLHVYKEAAVGAPRRVADSVAILGRPPTNVAATGHVYSPLVCHIFRMYLRGDETRLT
jgi:hypothetical protein